MMVEVYFDNGNKAKFPDGKVVFDRTFETANHLDVFRTVAVANWNHVCFVRVVDDKEDDDE